MDGASHRITRDPVFRFFFFSVAEAVKLGRELPVMLPEYLVLAYG